MDGCIGLQQLAYPLVHSRPLPTSIPGGKASWVTMSEPDGSARHSLPISGYVRL
ncbi:hypothetical protein [Acrocarpospora macrocephala]|nr:hypothetical protein [Acrocarpospora macrocephala]